MQPQELEAGRLPLADRLQATTDPNNQKRVCALNRPLFNTNFITYPLNQKIIYLAWIFILVVFVSVNCFAQSNSLRCFTISVRDSIQLKDSLLISPNSISIHSISHTEHQYVFTFSEKTQRIFISNPLAHDSIKVCYRVFPIPLTAQYFLFDTIIRQNPLKPDYADPTYEVKSNREWWYSPGINYSGNFTRGLSTGNSQSLVLNSSLNLQLSGDLGDGFTILGAISDNQIPIQPEGNTRQIQEFDRLFIKLSKKNQHLTAGDFEIGKPTGYFMNYYKKNKGGILETQHQLKTWKIDNKVAFAISKGKSNRLTLKSQNGNQGPYRLFGNNNEQFIILLAGSEKVWIDGELLQRGEDSDYSIDYNLAEIRFTAKRIISDVSRVIIEFEYLDQNYTRSLSVLQTTAQKNNVQSYFNFYNEQDSKSPAVEGDLDSLDKIILSQSGDDLKNAVRNGIMKAGSNFNVNRIYYRERDTSVTVNGIPTMFTFLLYDPDADSTALQVGFSEVLQGNGQYRLKQSTANGRVYEWIAPDAITGKNSGNYEPVVPLIAPQQHLMMTTGLNWQSKKNLQAGVELAISSLDKNRLSNLQDNDNVGIALRIQSSTPQFRFIDSFISLQANVYYEFNQRNFTPINPYRSVEFARDWNISSQIGSEDHLPKFKLITGIGRHLQIDYEHVKFIRSIGFNGQKHLVNAIWSDSLTRIQLSYDLLTSKDDNENAIYVRPNFQINRILSPTWKIQLKGNRERNERKQSIMDSISLSSFYFDILEAGITKESQNKFKIILTARHRIDYSPFGNEFSKYSTSDELVLESNLRSERIGNFDIKMSARNISYSDNQVNDSLGRIYFLGAFDHQISFLKKFINLKNYYELQSGVEPRQEFVFEEKRPGEGNFIYIDFDHDGVRQINEYVLASPGVDTARFVRFQLFNSEYVQVYQSSWNQFLNFDLKNILKGKSKLSKVVQAISFESGFRFTSKVSRESNVENRINPLYFLKNTNDLIGYNSYIQQNLYYNRSHPVFELQGGFQQNGQQLLLTSGTDSKKLLNTYVKSRVTLFKKLDCNLEVFEKNDEKTTQYYADQNYQIKSIGIKPGILYRLNQFARFYANFTIRNSEESIKSQEKASLIESEAGAATFLFKKLSLRTTLKFISIDYTGEAGSILEYTMLDGYKDGNNFNWDFQVDYKINSLIQLQFSYSGRKAASSEILHTGRMQLRANF